MQLKNGLRLFILGPFLGICRKLFWGTKVQDSRLAAAPNGRLTNWQLKDLPKGVGTVSVMFRDPTFEIENSDIAMLPTLFDGSYEKTELDLLLGGIQNGTHFIDVSANVGIYSVLAKKRCPTDAVQVTAFEPSSEGLSILSRNIKKNNCLNIEIIPCAVSSIQSQVPLLRGSNLAVSKIVEISIDAVTVKCVFLDTFFVDWGDSFGFIDIKIDVEGHEEEVVMGSRSLISRKKPRILIEVVPRSIDLSSSPWASASEVLSDNYESFVLIQRDDSQVFNTKFRDSVHRLKLSRAYKSTLR